MPRLQSLLLGGADFSFLAFCVDVLLCEDEDEAEDEDGSADLLGLSWKYFSNPFGSFSQMTRQSASSRSADSLRDVVCCR